MRSWLLGNLLLRKLLPALLPLDDRGLRCNSLRCCHLWLRSFLLRKLLPTLLPFDDGGLRDRTLRALGTANCRLNAADSAHIDDPNRSSRGGRALAHLPD